jgi:glutamate transport system substrate-binding protein
MYAKRFTSALVLTALGLLAAACGGQAGGATPPVNRAASFPAGSTMERLAKAGKVTVGTKFDQPGFGLKGLDGKPAGFDVEIAKIIAGELGLSADKIEWLETPSKVREDYLEQGKVDLVAATYTINDKRKQRVGFAGPYYTAGQTIMVGKDNTTITGPDSLRDGTKKVCSGTGSVNGEKIKSYLKDVAAQLVLFDTYEKCRDALKSGQVDAVTTDNVILLGYIAKDQNAFKLVGDVFSVEPYGIGVPKGDDAFRAFINDVLAKTYQDGRWQKAWQATAGKYDTTPVTPPALNRY